MKIIPNIGRAKTVLVSGEGPAVITTIIAGIIEDSNNNRLRFAGKVNFTDSVRQHIVNTILPHVDQIIKALNITRRSFELSVVNIGAVSSSEVELSINGCSADLSIFMALLSAAMKLPIEQDIVFTGHIASKEGDISQVKQLETKIQVALIDDSISTMVYPSLDSDTSMKILKPNEYGKSKTAIRSCRGRIKLLEVNNTYELIKNSLTDESIALSSLNNGFYKIEIPKGLNEISGLISQYLLEENDLRFWKTLEQNLIYKKIGRSHQLIYAYFEYYIRLKKYPSQIGEELNKLVMSLPFSVKKSSKLFPLIKKDKYIRLIQNSTKNDHDDISLLHNALYGKIEGKQKYVGTKEGEKINATYESDRLEYIIEQINPDYIDLNITQPIDEARASYIIDRTIAKNYEEFLDTLTSFYTHILRCSNNHQMKIDHEKFSVEALELLKNTFPQKPEFKEAISIALNGNKGGLRFIFDKITEYLKKETRDKHVFAIINDAINPLNFELKKSLIKKIINREKGRLELNTETINPEQYVENYIEIIQEYARSKQSLNRIFKIY